MKNNEKHRKTGLDGRRFDGDVQRIDGKAQRVSKGTTPKQDDYRPPTAIYQPPRAPKTGEKLKTRFSQKRFFLNFKLNLGGLGVSEGMAWTIRSDSLELWQGLVLQDMGEVDFHVFWKYWKLTSSPNTSKLVLGPPDWSSDFCLSQGTISGAIK